MSRAASLPTAQIFPGVHLEIPSPSEASTIVRCVLRVLGDSNRTVDIVIAEELTAKAQLRHILERGAMSTSRGHAMLRDRPELGDVDLDALRALPEGTLGRELMRYLDAHGLDFRVADDVPVHLEDPDAAYLLRRIRKNHDIWHVLLGLGPQGHEEVLVHAFTLSQVGFPSSVAIGALGAVKHMVLEGRWACLFRSMRDAYELGRKCAPLFLVRWEDEFDRPLDEVRARHGICPIDPTGGAWSRN